MTYILEFNPARAILTTNDTANKSRTLNNIVWACYQIFNDTATIYDSKDTRFFSTIIDEVVYHVKLSVESANITMIIVTDGNPRLIGHVNVGGKYSIGVISYATVVNSSGKVYQVLCRSDLVHPVAVLAECPCAACPSEEDGEQRKF